KNYRWIYPPKEAVTIHGRDALTGYQFGSKLANHMFCKTCGVSVFNIINDFPLQPINARTLNGVDLDKLEVSAEIDPKVKEAIDERMRKAADAKAES
ncbi:MAG: hypothetical protein Q9187_007930, partial [Circinaria calcarea]